MKQNTLLSINVCLCVLSLVATGPLHWFYEQIKKKLKREKERPPLPQSNNNAHHHCCIVVYDLSNESISMGQEGRRRRLDHAFIRIESNNSIDKSSDVYWQMTPYLNFPQFTFTWNRRLFATIHARASVCRLSIRFSMWTLPWQLASLFKYSWIPAI